MPSMKKIKATTIKSNFHIIFYFIILKKVGLCNPPLKFRLATNSLTGNWKPGGIAPSAPLALERSKKLIIGSYLTPPVLL
jgi:hypothetical protein